MKTFEAFDDDMNTGFSMLFNNGFRVSVQFAEMNYSDERSAECCVFKNDECVSIKDEDEMVRGWMSPKEVLALMVEVEAL